MTRNVLFYLLVLATASVRDSNQQAESKIRTSCAEVKRSFVYDNIGPRHFVPDVPRTSRHLEVCPSQNASCCSKRMEKKYRMVSIKLLNKAFDDVTSEVAKELKIMQEVLKGETEQIAKAASKPVTEALVKSNFHLNTVHFINENLFDLDFLADTKHDAHESVQKFFYTIFLVMLSQSNNDKEQILSGEELECIAKQASAANTFQQTAKDIADQFEEARRRTQKLMQALDLAVKAINITSWFNGSMTCFDSLIRMRFCSHCRGFTLIQPCPLICEKNVGSCLGNIERLGGAWERYVDNLISYFSYEQLPIANLENSLTNISNIIAAAVHDTRNNGGVSEARKQCMIGSHHRQARSTSSEEVRGQKKKKEEEAEKPAEGEVKQRKTSTTKRRKTRRRGRRNRGHGRKTKKSRGSRVKPPYMMLKEDSSVKAKGDMSRVVLDFSQRRPIREEKSSKETENKKEMHNFQPISTFIERFVGRLNTTVSRRMLGDLIFGVCTNRTDAPFQVADNWGKCWNGTEISSVDQYQSTAAATQDGAVPAHRSNTGAVDERSQNNGVATAVRDLTLASEILEMLMLESQRIGMSKHPLIKEELPLVVIEKKNQTPNSSFQTLQETTTASAARNSEEGEWSTTKPPPRSWTEAEKYVNASSRKQQQEIIEESATRVRAANNLPSSSASLHHRHATFSLASLLLFLLLHLLVNNCD